MAPTDPQSLPRAFAAAIKRGDVEAALELWVEDPVMIAADGAAIRGRGALEQMLRGVMQQGLSFDIDLAGLYVVGDLALARGTLTLSGGAGTEAFEHVSPGTAVYVRGSDGWRIAIDAPWGLPAP